MGHTPYGYRIENGAAVINEAEADCVRRIFDNYISGMSLREAAKAAGHPLVHSTVKRMLTKKYYCGMISIRQLLIYLHFILRTAN